MRTTKVFNSEQDNVADVIEALPNTRCSTVALAESLACHGMSLGRLWLHASFLTWYYIPQYLARRPTSRQSRNGKILYSAPLAW